MQFVLDANVLFAALIKDGISLEIIINSPDQFFVPEFVFDEFLEHRQELLAKTKRSEEEFDEVFEILEKCIIVVPKDDYQDKLEIAESVAPDPDDVPYLALALILRIPIWSNDNALKEKQTMVKVYTTKDLLELA